MKTTTKIFAAFVLLVMPVSHSPALGLSNVAVVQWYSGGTLHRATASQWRQATYANKLATASDWVSAILGASGVRRVTGGNMDRLRPYAAQLVTCVDEAAPAAGNQSASELAAACMILLGYR